MPIRPRWIAASALVAGVTATAATWPEAAYAHGLVGRAYLPVPAWLFAWAAGAVLIGSFVALGALWSTPRLERAPESELVRVPSWLPAICGSFGVAAFLLVVVSGIAGSQIPTANIAPTAVFVLFWVAVPVLSVLLGDVFRAFNPWLAAARGVAFVLTRMSGTRVQGAHVRRPATREPLPYPDWLGHWPAVAGILGFGWLELVFVGRDQPATLGVIAVGYALLQLVGMAFFGVETWSTRADAFGVAFNLFSRLSPLDCRDGRIWRRPPLSGLAGFRAMPGSVSLLCAMLGTTTFDGLMNGPLWRAIAPPCKRALAHLGLGGTAALEVVSTLGLLASVLLCAGLYELGVRGMSSLSPRRRPRDLARSFTHSLAPIAFGYLLAHYFSLLVTQGQATAFLISDPLGTGGNLFGTAGIKIDYGLVSAALIWYVQVAALVSGHVSGLVLAHDRALVLYGEGRVASDSQRWMLVVMVSFTCLGLWLLSAVNT